MAGIVGAAGLCTVEDADAWRRRAVDALGRPPGALQATLSAARHVARPAVTPSPSGLARRERAPMLDRVDVLVALAERSAGPITSALVADAAALLGPVLRDEIVVRALLENLAPAHADVRRAAVVALGLLGRVPPLDGLARADALDVRALVLGVVFAAPDAALATVRQLGGEAPRTSTQMVLREAAARLEFGDVFNVVG